MRTTLDLATASYAAEREDERSGRKLLFACVGILILASLLIMAGLNGIATVSTSPLTVSIGSKGMNNPLAFKMLQSINDYRRKHNLPPLLPDSKLADLACNYSKWMATSSFFGHTAPGGFTLEDRVKAAGLLKPGVIYGENLALLERAAERRYISIGFIRLLYYERKFTDQEVVNEVVKKWYESSGHRRNMLNPFFTHVGIGVYEDSGKIYVTSIFKGST